MPSYLWYRDQKPLKLGDVNRYTIHYTTDDQSLTEIYLRVKNLEKTPLRAIHLLNGPFILYAHVVPFRYHHKSEFVPEDSRRNSEVVFKNAIKPGQTFNVKLYLNENSLETTHADGKKTYCWSCDIISQIILNRKASVLYDFMIGDDLFSMRRLNRSVITSLTKGDFTGTSSETPDEDGSSDTFGVSKNPDLQVVSSHTDDLWTQIPKTPSSPIHLVVITHGVFSNLTADMLYLRDQLSTLDENVVVTGYRGNAGRTEKGIHKLGVGVSFFVTSLIDEFSAKKWEINKISFVAHSLGGPVQLYALKHILQVKGEDYFKSRNILLEHFVCIASPMLGVLSEMSFWISWFLDLGTLGKTGRDLTLLKKLPLFVNTNSKSEKFKPVLESLPDALVQTLLKQFKLRTVYANAFNDGIVPLRTSSLLYLDWAAMGDVSQLKDHPEYMRKRSIDDDQSLATVETNALGHDVGAVPYGTSTPNPNVSGQTSHDDSEPSKSRTSNNDQSPAVDLFHRKRISRKTVLYSKISAKGTDTSFHDDLDGDLESDEEKSVQYNIPPKASAVESALSTMICPVPSQKFILRPQDRTLVIFHDRFYHFNNIPEDSSSSVGPFKRLFRSKEWKLEKQVKIAQKYHADGINWRKVLVYLPPDAHNNIVVRRRFANGYGWGVIDHLRDQIFEDLRLIAKM